MGRVACRTWLGLLGLWAVFAGCGGNVVVDTAGGASGASGSSGSTTSGAGGSPTCAGSDPPCCSTDSDCGGPLLCADCPDGSTICPDYQCVAGQCMNTAPACSG
jgi:hypothetical protein